MPATTAISAATAPPMIGHGGADVLGFAATTRARGDAGEGAAAGVASGIAPGVAGGTITAGGIAEADAAATTGGIDGWLTTATASGAIGAAPEAGDASALGYRLGIGRIS